MFHFIDLYSCFGFSGFEKKSVFKTNQTCILKTLTTFVPVQLLDN